MERKQLSNTIEELNKFDPISLSEMDGVALMSRTDTKFVFVAEILPELLSKLTQDYKSLEINSKRYADYKTDYFDTKDYGLYIAHHNSKLNRFKIRYREYVGSDLSFLEVKFKNSKGKTIKSRIKSWVDTQKICEEDNAFLIEKTPFSKDNLIHILTNNFSRITLVSKESKERLTLDFSLQFSNPNETKKLDNLVIAEVKQEGVDRSSKVMQILKEFGIREASFSKYCTGAALLNKNLKYNKFKGNLLYLNKIHNNEHIWNTAV